ncbi:MAG TPA: hypothetical protein VGF55_20815 [Gemmataceae bacterium]|jgi:hypothetical protein
MPMPPYAVLCYTPGCGRPAAYKVAARWSDGVTSELKTYGLACEACLPAWFRRARQRQAVCRIAGGETLGGPGIYGVERGRRDQNLERLTELEVRLANC